MIGVGMCADRRYLVPALVTLVSLADSHGEALTRQITVYLLSPDITRAEAYTAESVTRRLGYRGLRVRRLPMPEYEIRHGAYISRATFLRFCFDAQLVSEPLLLYIDADILVCGDMMEPFNRLGEAKVGAVRDEFNHTLGVGPALPRLAEDRPDLCGRPYFNAGVLWTTTAMLPILNRGAKVALLRRQYIHFNDQDALNLWLHTANAFAEFEARFNRFELDRFREVSDWADQVVQPGVGSDEASAVHFIGAVKPWLRGCPQTPAVRLYGSAMRRTRRLIARTRDICLDVQTQWR